MSIPKSKIVVPLLLLAALSVQAADDNPPPPDANKPAPTIEAEGTLGEIHVVHEDYPRLTAPNKTWILVGKLKSELLRAKGHKAYVRGTQGTDILTTPTIDVASYELLSYGGKRPYVGVLVDDEDGNLWLRAPSAFVELSARNALLQKLRHRLRCKVWIIGRLKHSTLQVQKFDWLSCEKPSAPTKGEQRRSRSTAR